MTLSLGVAASFSSNTLSLVNRGFVYAIAHVRGGKDKGYGWYDDGKRAHKMNTFTDFIACARHLVAERYTVADIAHVTWVNRSEESKIDLAKYPNVKRWHESILARPAVQRGLALVGG